MPKRDTSNTSYRWELRHNLVKYWLGYCKAYQNGTPSYWWNKYESARLALGLSGMEADAVVRLYTDAVPLNFAKPQEYYGVSHAI